MLIRTEPFRELDRWSQQLMGTLGTLGRPATMPMDAWRDGDEFVVEMDLPGVDPSAIDLDVERNVITVRAERTQPEEHQGDLVMAERPRGTFSRQLVLGETLDTDNVRAGYDAGVLVLRIPIAEQAKPRRIEIASGQGASTEIGAGARSTGAHASAHETTASETHANA